MSTKKRDIRLDILKGIAILFVVIGHAVCNVYDTVNYPQNIIFKLAYSFHMPLFFFVSGYLTGFKKIESLNGDFLKKKFVRLMLPYFIWTFIFNIVIPNSISGRFLLVLKVWFVEPMYWFLPCLLFCNIFLVLTVRTKWPVVMACILTCFSCGLYFVTKKYTLFFNNIFWYFPFFYGAFYIAQNREKLNGKAMQTFLKISLILYPLSMFIYTSPAGMYELWFALPQPLVDNRIVYLGIKACLVVLSRFIIPSIGICFYWEITKITVNYFTAKLSRPLVCHKMLAILGVYSLQIYMCHGLSRFIQFSSNSFWNSVAVVAADISYPILIGFFIKKSKKLNSVMFGM